MSDYREEFISEGDGMVKYRRTMPMIPSGNCIVELYLTERFIHDTEKTAIDKYLNHAVTEYLTRNGVQSCD